MDVSAAWRQRGPALRVGIIGVLIPLVVGTACAYFLPDRYLADPDKRILFALFLGTTMAISAMVIIARVLHDMDLVKTDLGLVTLCGYAVNDIMAWVILSIVLGLATPEGASLGTIALTFTMSIVFTGFCLTVGRGIVDSMIGNVSRHVPNNPGAVLSVVCCVGLATGVISHNLGLTALLGFFLAGIMAGEARALSERTRHVISEMVHSVFVPLYFAGIGLQYDFLREFDWFIVFFVTALSIGTKFVGAWLGALGTGLSSEDRLSIGIAFTPSGVTGIVVADVALEHGILTPTVFVAIVVSAIVSTMAVAPWLSWSIARRKSVSVLSVLVRPATSPSLRSKTRSDAIKELCDGFGHDGERYAAAVLEREELTGTGEGGGVAFPHARIAGLGQPLLVVGRSVAGIEWDAPDGLPAHLVFLLITPQGDEDHQVGIHATLSKGLAGAGAKEELLNAGSAAGFGSALLRVFADQGHQAPPLTTVEELVGGMLQPDASQRIEEIVVPADSPLIGRTLSELKLRQVAESLVIAVRNADDTHAYRPSGDLTIEPHQVLIVMVATEQVERLRKYVATGQGTGSEGAAAIG